MLVGNPVLNQHLCDTFSAKVLELNETAFSLTDDDDGVQANEDHEVNMSHITRNPAFRVSDQV